MTRSENGRGGPKPLTEPGIEPGSQSGIQSGPDEGLRRIEAATDHLGRLQQILLEMLRSDGTLGPVPQLTPDMPAAQLSRPALDRLARNLGDPPLRNGADQPRRGLRLVGGHDVQAAPDHPDTPPCPDKG